MQLSGGPSFSAEQLPLEGVPLDSSFIPASKQVTVHSSMNLTTHLVSTLFTVDPCWV